MNSFCPEATAASGRSSSAPIRPGPLTRPLRRPPAALARQLTAYPVLEPVHVVLFGHQHSGLVRPGSETLLHQLADLGVLAHDLRDELNCRLDIEAGLRQRLRRDQPLGTDPGLRGPQGQVAHDAHVVDMRHQVDGWRERQVLVAELALARAQARERYAVRLSVAGPARRPGAQATAKLRFRASGMLAALGIVLGLHDAASVDRPQPAEIRMHARAMQAP